MQKKEFFKYLDDNIHERIRFRFTINKGKIIDVVIQYESLLNGKWRAITRYDCAHGFFHRDFIFPNGEKDKKEISIQNLNHAIDYAEQDFKDRWEFYKAKFLKLASK